MDGRWVDGIRSKGMIKRNTSGNTNNNTTTADRLEHIIRSIDDIIISYDDYRNRFYTIPAQDNAHYCHILKEVLKYGSICVLSQHCNSV